MDDTHTLRGNNRSLRRLGVALAVLLVSMGSADAGDRPSIRIRDEAPETTRRRPSIATKHQTRIVKAGKLRRAVVDAVIDRGAQRLIASIQVAPHLLEGRFVGFRIVGVGREAPFVNSSAIRPGDVILRVNQEPIERPEQFMRAWELVKQASNLEIALLRGDQHLLYRWAIVP